MLAHFWVPLLRTRLLVPVAVITATIGDPDLGSFVTLAFGDPYICR